jgi:phosphoribosylformylglycinamidine synthase
MQGGLVVSAHDCSEGGVLLAAVEMAFGGGLGLTLELENESLCFAETPSRYLLEVSPNSVEPLQVHFEGIPLEVIGTFNTSNEVTLGDSVWKIDDLCSAWKTGMVI